MYLEKLVSSADSLLHRMYCYLPQEEKQCVDQWFRLKRDYDSMRDNVGFSPIKNLPGSSLLPPVDEISENDNSTISSVSDYYPREKRPKKSILVGNTSVNSKKCHTKCGSKFENSVNDYMAEFKAYTDASLLHWISNLSFKLLASIETSHYNQKDTSSKNSCVSNCNTISNVTGIAVNQCLLKMNTQFTKERRFPYDGVNHANSTLYLSCFSANAKHCSCYKCQIQHFQQLRLPLIHMRKDIVDNLKGDPLETSSKYKDYLKFEIIIEVLDISIEMKNQLNLGHDVIESYEITDEADAITADCLNMLSSNELKCLLITFLRRVIDIRESSSKLDKEILKQDNFVFYQRYVIRNLQKTINDNKSFYEKKYLVLRKEYEDKLRSVCHRVPAGTSLEHNVPDVKVTRQKNKLIIQQEKIPPR